jgi:hypothetical protein
MDESGLYQCFEVTSVSGAHYEVYAHYDMGLPTPGGAGTVFHLRVASAPVSCGALCSAGEVLYSSNTHNCGVWNSTGTLAYTPLSIGTYCLVAVACGNDGRSCAGLTAIDDLYFHLHGAVEDWVLS